MPYTIEDLGPVAWGDLCMNKRFAIDPRSGDEVAIVALSRGGFLVINLKTRSAQQVAAPKAFTEWWAIAQAPDRSVYQVEYNGGVGDSCITRWNWDGAAEIVAHVPGKSFFTVDVAPDGCVYAPEYSQNIMYRYNPSTGDVDAIGEFAAFGDHIRDVVCGQDGLVYVNITNYKVTQIVVLDPANGKTRLLGEGDAAGLKINGTPVRDSDGRVCVSAHRWGRPIWFEAVDGELRKIDQQTVSGASGMIAFNDGSYLSSIDDIPHLGPASTEGKVRMNGVDAAGEAFSFEVSLAGVPLRIFSVAKGLGRIWTGTFIPLTLASYDPATDERYHYGNPTKTNGEIYTMIESDGQMYLGSYYGAVFTRFDPNRPWRRADTAADNPGHLGRLREERMLQRPYGVARDGKGYVYFTAMGGYGIPDSGLCRIDTKTGEMTAWEFPETTITMLIYLQRDNLLMFAERRQNENAMRLTCVNPDDGSVVRSQIIVEGEGQITDLLYDGDDTIFGLLPGTATIFAYSLSSQKIVRQIEELGLSHHCYNTLMFGPDDRIWALTRQCVFAVNRELTIAEVISEYEDHADGSFYRFGMCTGDDGHIYFANGPHLMRLLVS